MIRLIFFFTLCNIIFHLTNELCELLLSYHIVITGGFELSSE